MDSLMFGYVLLSVGLTSMFVSNAVGQTCTTLQRCQNCFFQFDFSCRYEYKDSNDEQVCASLLNSKPEAVRVTYTGSFSDPCIYYTCATSYIRSSMSTVTYRLGGCVNGCNNVTLSGGSDLAIPKAIVPDETLDPMSLDECRTYCIDIAFNGTNCTFMHSKKKCSIYTTCPVGGCSEEYESGTTVEAVACDYLIIKCSVPIDPTDGIVTYSGTMAGDTALYSCNTGHTIDNTVITCGNDGNWDGAQPSCNPIDCSAPWQVTNGSVNVSATTYLNTASYSCNTGYTLTGSVISICQDNGTWNGTQPSCDPVNCDSPLSISNGTLIVTSTFYQGTAYYSCDNGYIISGPSTRTCQANGGWDGTDPSCDPVNCDTPSSLDNGTVTVTGTTNQQMANYTCDLGFYIAGNETRTCQEDGNWTGSDPYCAIQDCGIPDNIIGGVVVYNYTYLNSVADHQCNSGCTIDGDNQTKCLSNGSWSLPTPSCYCPLCLPLSNPLNGVVSTTHGNADGSIASYSCNPGFTLSKPNVRNCLPSGQWTSTAPTCDIMSGTNNTTNDTTKVKNNAIYLAPCLCNHNRQFTNLTEDEIIAQLIRETKIDPKNTALAQQKLTCKDDTRTSSTVIGSVGASVIAVIFGLFFILDCTSLFGHRICKRKTDYVL